MHAERRISRAVTIGLLVGLAAVCYGTAGCGSSTTTPAATTDPLNGTYAFWVIGGEALPEESRTNTGAFDADGMGTVTAVAGTENEEGMISMIMAPPFPYAVSAGNILALNTSGGPAANLVGRRPDGRGGLQHHGG